MDPMDLRRVCQDRFRRHMQRGIDFAEQESLAVDAVGAPSHPLFCPEIAERYSYTQELNLKHFDEFTSSRTASDTTRENNVNVFATFKKFSGGAELSSSARHQVLREVDSRCISMQKQILNAELDSNPPQTQENLTPDAQGRIREIQLKHGRKEDTCGLMMRFLKDFGTHYVVGFKAGAELSLSLQQASFQETECSTRHNKAKLGFADLCGVNAQKGNRTSSATEDWSRGLQVFVVGGPSASVALAPDQAADWLRGVEVGNAVVLECFLRPVSELFGEGGARQLMHQRIEHRIFQSCYRHSFDALELVMSRSLQRMRCLLDENAEPLQELCKAMSCAGCDAYHVEKPVVQFRAQLTPLRQQLEELAQVRFNQEQLAQVLTQPGVYGGQLATLRELIQKFKEVASGARILNNLGVGNSTPSFCRHLDWGPKARNRVVGKADDMLIELASLIAKVRQHLVTNPSWFEPHFRGMKNRMMVGPTNVGKGLLLNKVLDRVYGSADPSVNRPKVEQHETVDDVRSFQLGPKIVAHDPPGCGTDEFPLGPAYIAQLGLHEMDSVALLSLADSPENNTVIGPLLTALVHYNVRHCVVLTKADAIYQEGEDEEVILREKVERWRAVVPHAEIFVTSSHNLFRRHNWNQLEFFLDWFLDELNT